MGCLLLLTWCISIHQIDAQAELTAELSAEHVYENAQFNINYQLTNGKGSQFQPPDFSPFVVTGGPVRSQQTTIVNGRMSSYEGYGYTLRIDKAGSYRIPPAKILVGGKWIQSKPLDITVLPPLTRDDLKLQMQNSESPYFITARLSSDSVYVGERVELIYDIYTRVSISRVQFKYQPDLSSFKELHYLIQDNAAIVEIDGQRYRHQIISERALYADQPGTYDIDAAQFELFLSKQNRRSLFFDNYDVQYVTTNALKLTVLPIEGSSSDRYSGLVGHYTMQSLVKQTQMTTDDAISLRMTISGDGDEQLFRPAQINYDPRLEAYPPKIISQSQEEATNAGHHQAVIEYFYTTNEAGKYFIQPIFEYFDVDSGTYHTIEGDTTWINVSEGSGARQDITSASDRSTTYRSVDKPSRLTRQWISFPIAFYLWMGGVLMIGLLGWWSYHRHKVRLRKPPPTLLERTIAQLNALEHESIDIGHRIEAIIMEYFRLQTDIPASEWNDQKLNRWLQNRSWSPEDINELNDLIRKCRYAAYAGIGDVQKAQWLAQAKALINHG